MVAAVRDLLDVVHAARPDQGWVEPLEVVGSHEDYPALRGGDSVDGIEEATEGEPVGALIGGLGFGV